MDQPSLHTTQLKNWQARLQAGDATAGDELMRGVANRLETLARQMLRRHPVLRGYAQTEDVLQNSLVRLWRSLPTIQLASMKSFYGFAATLIRRELIDLARHFQTRFRQGGNQADFEADSSGEAAAEPAQPAADAGDLAKWQAFHEEVEKLPVEEREVVSLVFYHGWTQREVADLFQVNERTVRRWWQAALFKMHDVMKHVLAEA